VQQQVADLDRPSQWFEVCSRPPSQRQPIQRELKKLVYEAQEN
jgi:hypothetical protein